MKSNLVKEIVEYIKEYPEAVKYMGNESYKLILHNKEIKISSACKSVIKINIFKFQLFLMSWLDLNINDKQIDITESDKNSLDKTIYNWNRIITVSDVVE